MIPVPGITLTQGASDHLTRILLTEPAGTFMRLSVQGGGCAGFQYSFTLDTESILGDSQFGPVVIDDVSLALLAGVVIDYEEDLVRSGLVIRNPNAQTSCGCGNSFSI